MTDAEKGAILVLHSLQYTVVMISHHVGRPWSTVKIFIVEPQREAQSTTYPDQDALLYYLVKIGGLFGVISKKIGPLLGKNFRILPALMSASVP